MTRQVLIGVTLIVAVGVGGAVLLTGGGARTTFEHFDGSVVRLADWAGTPMVVNYWASWCPPCVAEMSAAFEPVHAHIGDQVAFIGLNLEDDPDAAAEIVELTGVA